MYMFVCAHPCVHMHVCMHVCVHMRASVCADAHWYLPVYISTYRPLLLEPCVDRQAPWHTCRVSPARLHPAGLLAPASTHTQELRVCTGKWGESCCPPDTDGPMSLE